VRRRAVRFVAIAGAVVGGALLAAAASSRLLAAWHPAAASIPTAEVVKGTFVDVLPVRGEIRPVRSVVLTAPSSGADLQIVELVANGSTVAAGDVVVVFDASAQQRTLEQKQSELKQAESEIKKAEAEQRRRVHAAQTEAEQARSALARARLDAQSLDLRSRVDAEKLKLAVADAEAHLRELEAKVKGEEGAAAADVASARQKRDKAQYDVAETTRIIESLTMRAPASGTISLLPNFRAGGPGSRTAPEFKRGDRAWFGAAIAELPDLRQVKMTCRIDEADRARVQAHAAAIVRVDAVPDRDLDGRIQDISLVAKPDFTTWPPVRNFDVTIALSSSDPRLRSGMSASARIELDRLPNALMVPAAAVFQRGAETIAYVVSSGAVDPKPITIVRRSRDQAVIGSGVREHDRVALRAPDSEGTR
jgi:multidrug efflux pump subunit AcrA (membrane-fusion protein)